MKKRENSKRKRIGSIIIIVFGSFLLVISGLFLTASVVFHFEEWHDFDPSLIVNCPQALKVNDNEGRLVCVIGSEKRIWVGINELQKHTLDAFVSAEDARFYTHHGIDLYRIFGAAWADLKAGSYVQGASTISQQLIKLSHLSNEKTLDRKLEEAVLSAQLERFFTKDQILEMYLNYIYFGGGYYGIETASLGYFGVHAKELTTAQSAQLAGILKSPSAYAPHLDMNASISRRNGVLSRMLEYGYIDESEYEAACGEECHLVTGLPKERNELIDYGIKEAQAIMGISYDELTRGGYTLCLYMDSGIMQICRDVMKDDTLFPSDNAEAAIAVVDSAGGIAAMIGSRGDYAPDALDRASMIERQPGSLIKPILVYAPALELNGYSAASVVTDEPTSFGDYSPRNSDNAYYGKVTLREAIVRSLNIPAVKVFEDVGIANAVAFAETAGISFENESIGLPLALGGFTRGVSPLEMAGAYSAFSRGGLYQKPAAVKTIKDVTDRVVYERPLGCRRIMSEENAYILTDMLKSVAEEGTGKKLASLNIPIAAKTGTSVSDDGVRDAWCAAYTTDYTAAAWMGTDNAKEGVLPFSSVGGNNTAQMIMELFETVYKNKYCEDFIMPEDVISCRIDVSKLEDGKVYLAGEYTPEDSVRKEYFIRGTEPKNQDPYAEKPRKPQSVGWCVSANGKPVISFYAESDIWTYVIIRSEGDSEESIVYTVTGVTGDQSWTDADVIPGGIYFYTVFAVHQEHKEADGSAVKSEPSRKMRVVVPFIL